MVRGQVSEPYKTEGKTTVFNAYFDIYNFGEEIGKQWLETFPARSQSNSDSLLSFNETKSVISKKFQDWFGNKIYAYNNKHSLGSNTKAYGGKTRQTDSQNSYTTASKGRELYDL